MDILSAMNKNAPTVAELQRYLVNNTPNKDQWWRWLQYMTNSSLLQSCTSSEFMQLNQPMWIYFTINQVEFINEHITALDAYLSNILLHSKHSEVLISILINIYLDHNNNNMHIWISDILNKYILKKDTISFYIQLSIYLNKYQSSSNNNNNNTDNRDNNQNNNNNNNNNNTDNRDNNNFCLSNIDKQKLLYLLIMTLLQYSDSSIYHIIQNKSCWSTFKQQGIVNIYNIDICIYSMYSLHLLFKHYEYQQENKEIMKEFWDCFFQLAILLSSNDNDNNNMIIEIKFISTIISIYYNSLYKHYNDKLSIIDVILKQTHQYNNKQSIINFIGFILPSIANDIGSNNNNDDNNDNNIEEYKNNNNNNNMKNYNGFLYNEDNNKELRFINSIIFHQLHIERIERYNSYHMTDWQNDMKEKLTSGYSKQLHALQKKIQLMRTQKENIKKRSLELQRTLLSKLNKSEEEKRAISVSLIDLNDNVNEKIKECSILNEKCHNLSIIKLDQNTKISQLENLNNNNMNINHKLLKVEKELNDFKKSHDIFLNQFISNELYDKDIKLTQSNELLDIKINNNKQLINEINILKERLHEKEIENKNQNIAIKQSKELLIESHRRRTEEVNKLKNELDAVKKANMISLLSSSSSSLKIE